MFRNPEWEKRIIDLGASPGSWSQYALERTGGFVLAVDLNPIRVNGVKFFAGDLRRGGIGGEIKQRFGLFDLMLCDAAPKLGGIKETDQARVIELCSSAFLLADEILERNGAVVIKSFQGDGFKEFYDSIRYRFRDCRCFSPQASKKHSSEIYVIGRSFIR